MESKSATQAEVALVNGRIYTVDERQPWAEAVAIRAGRFIAVGSTAEIQRHVGPSTRVADLGGRFAMPGVYDMHTHPDLALAPKYSNQLDVAGDPTPEQLAAAIRSYAAEHPGDRWIYGKQFVWFTFRKQRVAVNRQWLDSILPDRPIAIHDRSWGSLLVNSKALALAGIDANTPDPGNGYIERDALTGEPTGILVDGAYSLIYRVMPPPPAAALQRAYRDALHFQASRGVVGVKYVHVCEHRLDALHALDTRGLLTARVEAAISWQDDIFPVRRRWELMAGARHYYRSRRLNANAVKFHFDGTHEARSAYLATAWKEGDLWRGHLNLTPEHLADLITQMDREGIRVIAHCTGDGASDVFLDAVAEARRRTGSARVRHQCAHCTLLLDRNLKRFAELEVIAEFSPVGWVPGPFAYARRDAYGEDRMRRAYNFKGVLDAGGIAVMGTDWPVSALDPWIGFEGMVTRRDATAPELGAFYGEPISLEAAIRVMTWNGAWSMGLEHEAGSITTGKRADLIVLDRNLFETDPAGGIRGARVELTLVDGEPTWDAGRLLEPLGMTAVWRYPPPQL
ncbi:MAG TPA: amidohydrolase [Steroidobacteraceae bacterium]|nr:amidohydrolase [Steroidobacteraceae bacterium]